MVDNCEWFDIKDFENLYQVNKYGDVKSLGGKYKKSRILKPKVDRYGYYNVVLFKDNKMYYKTIHRLVAETLIPNPSNLPQINHIDENKLNNNVDNLEWCSPKYNSNYGTRNKRIGENGRRPINQYTIQGEYIKTWSGMVEIEQTLGIRHGNIYRCCRGLRKSTHGYKWAYKEETHG